MQDVELYHYELTAPDNYRVTVNGKEAEADGAADTDVSGFVDAAEYVKLPQTLHYSFDHLTAEPDIQICNADADMKPVSFDLSEEIDLSEELPVFCLCSLSYRYCSTLMRLPLRCRHLR